VRGIRLSDVDFLPKPCSIDELLTRIQRVRDQATARRKLLLEAEHDELTGLGNLRLLRSRMIAERSRVERYGSALTLVVVDVDKLKQINDQHGHVAGSRALKAIADVLRKEVRETDLPIRYGGDEFVVLLPHTTLAEGLAFANRALAHIAEIKPGGIAVTVSIGIASLGTKAKAGSDASGTNSDDDLLRRADASAYRAKRLGGNRVCADGDD
jgi:diguanylate cyclase (GGDEF)-like protein